MFKNLFIWLATAASFFKKRIIFSFSGLESLQGHQHLLWRIHFAELNIFKEITL